MRKITVAATFLAAAACGSANAAEGGPFALLLMAFGVGVSNGTMAMTSPPLTFQTREACEATGRQWWVEMAGG